jgi:hypothetical protein
MHLHIIKSEIEIIVIRLKATACSLHIMRLLLSMHLVHWNVAWAFQALALPQHQRSGRISSNS